MKNQVNRVPHRQHLPINQVFLQQLKNLRKKVFRSFLLSVKLPLLQKESTSPPHTPNSPTLTPGSPLQSPGSPSRRKGLNAVGRSHTVASTASEFSTQSLEGKRYGCIQLPNMMMIEILEILLRTGLEIMDVSSDYDAEKILHQNFVFSKSRSTPQKIGLY